MTKSTFWQITSDRIVNYGYPGFHSQWKGLINKRWSFYLLNPGGKKERQPNNTPCRLGRLTKKQARVLFKNNEPGVNTNTLSGMQARRLVIVSWVIHFYTYGKPADSSTSSIPKKLCDFLHFQVLVLMIIYSCVIT